MNEIKVFKNTDFGEIRTVMVDNESYFVGKDVAAILGYSDTFGALKKHVDEEDKQNCQNDSFESNRGLTVINESGLYSLILSSKLPTAKEFKRWVTSDVLPTIRKTGGYVANEETFLNTYLPNADEQTKLMFKSQLEVIRNLNNRIEVDKPKVLFAEAVDAAKTTILVGDLAKLLKQNGVDIGQKRLFKWLRENGYLIKRKGADYNSPTQKSMEMKLFEVKETAITHADGHVTINKTSKVTGKGQMYFINKFLNSASAAC